MNDEQKRKENLEAAKGWLAIAKKDNNAMAIQILENLFPELRENEDERIRDAQLNYWRGFGGKEWHGVPIQEFISWLEKQKPAWSEEDEKMLDEAIKHVRNYQQIVNPANETGESDLTIWLKSLKPNHWKPSEEQLRAIINSAQGLYQCKEKGILLDLYEQLKKL